MPFWPLVLQWFLCGHFPGKFILFCLLQIDLVTLGHMFIAENVGEASVCGKLMGLDGFASLFCFSFTPEGGGRSTPRPHTG